MLSKNTVLVIAWIAVKITHVFAKWAKFHEAKF